MNWKAEDEMPRTLGEKGRDIIGPLVLVALARAYI